MPPKKKKAADTSDTEVATKKQRNTSTKKATATKTSTDDTEETETTTSSPKRTSPRSPKKEIKKSPAKKAPVKKVATKKGKKKVEEEEEDEEEAEEKEETTTSASIVTDTRIIHEEVKTSSSSSISTSHHKIPTSSPIKSILSWNVNGIRAAIKNGAADYLKKQDADIVCLSEIKVDTGAQAGMPSIYPHMYWNPCTAQKGYSGTALFSKIKPINVTYGMGKKEHDTEGRIITAEFEHFYIVNTYVPNAGQKLDRLPYRVKQWDLDMFAYLKKLQQLKPVIWTGDLNVAHLEIDIHNPKTNKKSAGFTKEERDSFGTLLADGFVDAYRHLYPTAVGYTYWTHKFSGREKNLGWRLDYYVISPSLVPLLSDVIIESELTADKTRRSDHAPLVLRLK